MLWEAGLAWKMGKHLSGEYDLALETSKLINLTNVSFSLGGVDRAIFWENTRLLLPMEKLSDGKSLAYILPKSRTS